MEKITIKTRSKKLLADTLTPVSIYLRIREQFPQSVILESADYHASQNSFSYIACDPIASFQVNNNEVSQQWPNQEKETFTLKEPKDAIHVLQDFASTFSYPKTEHDFISNGLFGHMTYDAVNYYEDIKTQGKSPETDIPQIAYKVYRYVIAINHFKNELYLFEHTYGTEQPVAEGLETLEFFVSNPKLNSKKFSLEGEEESNLTDPEMESMISKCISHCKRGDVFQVVPSRRFQQNFKGDDFNVYRALRSINPSPYLFYFDGGNYHIFGSSPEKQIQIKGNLAEINPIAGTFKRSGNDENDRKLAKELHADPKESAEHVMLVDLARNDLSRSASKVTVEVFKEVQFYSHVIHLVSTVKGVLNPGTNPLQLVADTFPAGTLSGAPKHMAMKIIDGLEPTNRSIYGGAIGFLDFDGNFNHAIAIRTFLSKNNSLFFQAGMGVVAKSDIQKEMQEVGNKLGALRSAIIQAQDI